MVADRYQTALDSLGSTGSAARVAHLATCGVQCNGVLEAVPPALAVTLKATVSLSALDAASQNNIVAAMSHTTAYVLAFRAAGLPNSAQVQVTSPATYERVYSPPPPRPPRPPRPPYPPGMAPHSPPPPPTPPTPVRGHHGDASPAPARAAAAAGALLAAAAALAL